MLNFIQNLGLYTDFYELAMAQGYYFCGKKNETATFDYFFRTNPFQGGFTVFAGLADFLEILEHFTYSKEDIEFLKAQGFKPEFLNYDNGRLSIDYIFSRALRRGKIKY